MSKSRLQPVLVEMKSGVKMPRYPKIPILVYTESSWKPVKRKMDKGRKLFGTGKPSLKHCNCVVTWVHAQGFVFGFLSSTPPKAGPVFSSANPRGSYRLEPRP